ncbi:hypothetical protein [Aminipila sp.]|uniref:hypothetical protein n=1 Tax=Aminipila sp. TaxID=2060095 RepID=UPI00289FFA1D|nr:hypothetical protein [Aminipila sp.]
MSNDNIGTISPQGNIMRVENALVEEVSTQDGITGYLLISHAVPQPNCMTSIEILRLNISTNSVILNALGSSMCLYAIRKGMRVDALFSPIMTRSIPPQSNAFLVIARREFQCPLSVTVNRIAMIDVNNNFLYTGNPNNVDSQIRFVIPNSTIISDQNGNPIDLDSLQQGQMVRVTHANFQTASIPPQTTAFHVQLI